MLVYAKVVNEQTKQCDIALGNDDKYYESIGMTKQEVEQCYDGSYYLKGYAPQKPEPTTKEKVVALEKQYQMNRWQREIILADNSGASEYTKTKAQEIENLAKELR